MPAKIAVGVFLCEKIQGIEAPTENRFRIDLEPVLEDRRVHLAKVDRMLEVTLIQIVQAGLSAMKARADAVADEEHGRGGTVVSTPARILVDPPAEFREDHRHDPVRRAITPERFLELG